MKKKKKEEKRNSWTKRRRNSGKELENKIKERAVKKVSLSIVI
jgi:hypothetical protein